MLRPVRATPFLISTTLVYFYSATITGAGLSTGSLSPEVLTFYPVACTIKLVNDGLWKCRETKGRGNYRPEQ